LLEQENKIKSIHEDSEALKHRLRESYYGLNLKLDKLNKASGDGLDSLKKSRNKLRSVI